MKNCFLLILTFTFLTFGGGCIENEMVLFEGSLAEFDATVWNTPAVGRNYPIITRVVGFGRTLTAADPVITRTTGTMNVRVNLVSAHFTEDQVLSVSVVDDVTTAVSGTHYVIPSSVTIPANSSFGLFPITIINFVGAGPRELVIQIDGNENIRPSQEFRRLGIRIP